MTLYQYCGQAGGFPLPTHLYCHCLNMCVEVDNVVSGYWLLWLFGVTFISIRPIFGNKSRFPNSFPFPNMESYGKSRIVLMTSKCLKKRQQYKWAEAVLTLIIKVTYKKLRLRLQSDFRLGLYCLGFMKHVCDGSPLRIREDSMYQGCRVSYQCLFLNSATTSSLQRLCSVALIRLRVGGYIQKIVFFLRIKS